MPTTCASSTPSQKRAEEIIGRLSSPDSESKLRAVRDVKNEIIGNKSKKLSYIKLGAISRMMDILANENESSLLVQCAAAVGSFGFRSEDGLRAVFESGGLDHLLKMLSNPDEKVVEAGIRSLKMILQSKHSLGSCLWINGCIEPVLSLLGSSNLLLAEMAASVLARCCSLGDNQWRIIDNGRIHSLLSLLCTVNHRQGSLEALIAISNKNYQIAKMIADAKEGYFLQILLDSVKDKVPRTRFLACSCLITMMESYPEGIEDFIGGIACQNLHKNLLSTLLKLLQDRSNPNLADEIPGVIETLMSNKLALPDDSLMDAIDSVASQLESASCLGDHQVPAVLYTLAVMCSDSELNRQRTAESKVWPLILKSMEERDPRVCIAACKCVQNVLRSKKSMHKVAMAAVLSQLLVLLDKNQVDIKVAACSALCNAVLHLWKEHRMLQNNMEAVSGKIRTIPKSDTSKTSIHLVQHVGIPILAKLVHSPILQLRIGALQVLKNVAFVPNVALRVAISGSVTERALIQILQGSDVQTVGLAAGLLRNLLHGIPEFADSLINRHSGLGLELIQSLSSLLQRWPQQVYICTEVLYALCNVASLSDVWKDTVLASLIVPNVHGSSFSTVLQQSLTLSSPELSLACVFCVHNLVLPDSLGSTRRILKLKAAGLEELMHRLENSAFVVVQGRAALVGTQFRSISECSE